jgi:hypothetical protein
MATSRLDDTFLRFNNTSATVAVLMTSTPAGIMLTSDQFQTPTSRPALLTSATSVDSCVIDAIGNIFISGSYNSASVVPIYNMSGFVSSYSLPITTATTPYIVKFDKYGSVSAYTVLSNSGAREISSYFGQKLSLLFDSKGSLYWSGAFAGSATINHFSTTTSLTASFSLSSTISGFIAKYSDTGLALSYTQLERGPVKAMCTDPFTNLYVTGLIGSNLATTAVFSISSVPTISRINFSIPPFALNTTSAVASYIIKYTNDAPVGWTLVGSNGFASNCQLSDIHSDNYGTIYAVGTQNYVSSAYDFTTGTLLNPRFTFPYLNNSAGIIVKYNTTGIVNSINIISPTSVGSLGVSTAIAMALDSNGSLYATGSYTNTNTVTPVYNFFGTSTLNYGQFPTATTSSKLVGTGPIGTTSQQGYSLALSGDGSIVVSGGPGDDTSRGAAWVFVRSGTSYQQLSKLIGSGYTGVNANQGYAVDISKDGNTISVGAPLDDISPGTDVGSVFIFIRSGSNYFQFPTTTSKLTGTGFTGSSLQGASLALSSDGSVLAVGAFGDNSNVGATWVFVRTGGLGTNYVQLCPKLVGSGYTGATNIYQGNGVGKALGISGDGSTIVIGGYGDNSNTGAFWVFVRSGQGYSQYGGLANKYVGSGAVGAALQGASIAVSEDGSIIASSGTLDNTNIGATWIFVRSGNTYAQFCPKIVASGYTGLNPFFIGYNTSLSANGNILAISSTEDDQPGTTNVGATWVFVRSGQGYSQYGNATFKLVGSGYSGSSLQGTSTDLSSDGTILAAGGPGDNSSGGAVWVFNSIGPTSSYLLPTGTNSYINKWSSVGTAINQTVINTPGSTVSIACSQDDSVYVAGTKELLGTTAVYNFSTASSTLGVTLANSSNYVAKWNKYGNYSISSQNLNSTISNLNNFITTDSFGSLYFSGVFSEANGPVSYLLTTPSIVSPGITINSSISFSSSGNILVVGDRADNGNIGAAYVYKREGTAPNVSYTQLQKLIGSGYSGSPYQGNAVCISKDGDTIVSCGKYNDTNAAMTLYVFTRSGQTYTQLNVLTLGGYSNAGATFFGISSSISDDGSYIAVGNANTQSQVGGTWIFVRSGAFGTSYSQFNSGTYYLLGTGATGNSQQGSAVSLSNDGSYLAVGGINDNAGSGAVWIFYKNGAVYDQVGNKLIGSGYSSSTPGFGVNVSLLPDASSLAVGASNDGPSTTGSVFLFERSSSGLTSVYTQFGGATGYKVANGTATYQLGYSLTLSTVGAVSKLAVNGYGTAMNIYSRSTGVFQLNQSFGTTVYSSSMTEQANAVAIYGSVYEYSNGENVGFQIKDLNTNASGTLRYTFSSAVSNNIFLSKYLNDGTAFFKTPTTDITLNNIGTPISNNDVATKQYTDGSFETITVSNTPVDPSPNVVSVISPGPINRLIPIQPILDSGLNDNANCICVDNNNEFVYIGGMYSASVPNAVYNTDGSYSGFSFGATMASSVYSAYILKYNFSGQALGWTQFGSIANTSSVLGVTTDKSGNLYCTGFMSNSTNTAIYNFSNSNNFGTNTFSIPLITAGAGSSAVIISWTPTGIASRWTVLGNATASAINEQFTGIVLDSSQNIYACGQMLAATAIVVYDFASSSALGTARFTIPSAGESLGTF